MIRAALIAGAAVVAALAWLGADYGDALATCQQLHTFDTCAHSLK